MKLLDTDENLCNCKKDVLTQNWTISMTLSMHCLKKDYKLVVKNGELIIVLTRSGKLKIYIGCKKALCKVLLPSSDCCEVVHVAIVRSMCLQKLIVYVNGVVSCVSGYDESVKPSGDLELFNGKFDSHTMSKTKVYNHDLTLEQVKLLFIRDTNNRKELFKYVFNRLNEDLQFEDNIYSYIMTEDFFIYFIDESRKYIDKCDPLDNTDDVEYKNKYPEYSYTMYNIEQNEQQLIPVTDLTIIKNNKLDRKFNMADFVKYIMTWQFGMYEDLYPKGAIDDATLNPSGVVPKFGYWRPEFGFTPFTPFLGIKPPAVVPSAFNDTTVYGGNFKKGNMVSFIRILMNQYLETKSIDIRESISKLVDYILAYQKASSTGGIVDEFPFQNATNPNSQLISLKDGNYLNFLKICDCLINQEGIRNIIDDTRLSLLQNAYTKALDLLLALQVQIGSTTTIWSNYYDQNALTYANVASDQNFVNVQSRSVNLLSTLESAQILLYLMNMQCPSDAVAKAINAGCEWFKNHKFISWVQIFNDSTSNLNISTYKYNVLPESQVLFAHYHAIDIITPNVTYGPELGYTINPQDPVFIGDTDANCDALLYVHSTNTNVFPDNFNTMSFTNQEYDFGTWGAYLLGVCEEWKLIHAI